MQLKEKVIFTTVTLLFFCWLIYLSRSILTPFLFSIIIAYLLNPVVERFHRLHKMSRLHATSLILGLFLAIFVSVSFIILPTIYTQTIDLVESLPGYFKTLTTNIYPKISNLINKAGFNVENDFSNFAKQSSVNSDVLSFSKNILDNAITSTVVIINVFSLIFITPILIFYLLKDWNAFITKINDYLPKSSSSMIRGIFKEIDKLGIIIFGSISNSEIISSFLKERIVENQLMDLPFFFTIISKI